MSPRRLIASTIGDELRMTNNGLSRVFSASFKDRAAILPGGHMANAAYWYDGRSGNFVTSNYYMSALPQWVNDFNARKQPAQLMATGWNLLLPENNYLRSMPDNGAGEVDAFREGKTSFPHSFSNLDEAAKLQLIRSTPFGNDLLAEFVLQLIKNEKPGQAGYTDLLTISFSSTDYVGHSYGPNSMEVMDTYLRLDKQISRVLDALDQAAGKGNYLLFLTADHAVKPNGEYLKEHHFEAGNVDAVPVHDSLVKYCAMHFGETGLIEKVEDNHVYYNHKLIESKKVNIADLDRQLVVYLRNTFPQMNNIAVKSDFNSKMPTRSMSTFMLNGCNPYRSGDLVFDLSAGYLTGNYHEGTSHGAIYDYDTHVPLIFFGWKIKPGECNTEVYVEDIAPTIANLIYIQEPNASMGVPVVKSKR